MENIIQGVDRMSVFTERENEIVKDNLRSFLYNFGKVRIEREHCSDGFYVFCPPESESWVQYCYNIDYLNGWLYGCVQAVHKIIKPIVNE
jgi:hypothetical protein